MSGHIQEPIYSRDELDAAIVGALREAAEHMPWDDGRCSCGERWRPVEGFGLSHQGFDGGYQKQAYAAWAGHIISLIPADVAKQETFRKAFDNQCLKLDEMTELAKTQGDRISTLMADNAVLRAGISKLADKWHELSLGASFAAANALECNAHELRVLLASPQPAKPKEKK